MGLTLLYWYMGVGFVVLASLSIYGTWFRDSDEPRVIYHFNEEKASWKMRLANLFLVPLAIVFIFVPLWPFILSIELNFPWYKLKFWKSKTESSMPWTMHEEEPAFKVSTADLVEKLTSAEVEALEQVVDPLHAVPDLPFGHLNSAWQSFVDGLDPDCELWSFCGCRKTKHRDYQVHGYAALRGESIGAYFLTANRNMRVT